MGGRNLRKVRPAHRYTSCDMTFLLTRNLIGTYTYPISFAIPGNSPPTLDAAYGSVVWKLKANAHRPGAFTAKLTATREVSLIACPGEDDTEESENIIVERQWDSQLQYLISISGRSFHIGGTMPITITMLPLAKAKVHRISVILDRKLG